MSPLLRPFLNARVVVVTVRGELLWGELEGFDLKGNIILVEAGGSTTLLRSSEIVYLADVKEGEEVAAVQLKDTKNYIPNEHLIWQRVHEQKKPKRRKV